MRKTDISKYKDEAAPSILDLALSAAGGVFAFLGRIFFSILLAMAVTGIVIGLSLLFYILGIANEPQSDKQNLCPKLRNPGVGGR